jgi:hypothetical protein
MSSAVDPAAELSTDRVAGDLKGECEAQPTLPLCAWCLGALIING